MAQCHVMGWVGLLLFVFSTLLAGCQQSGELRDTVPGNSHDVSGELSSNSDFESDSLRSIEDDDFSDEDDFVWRQEEEEHRRFLEEFERTTMVHRRANLDLRLGGFFPVDSDFNTSLSLGFTGEIEVYKNLYLGLSVDYTDMDVDETIADVLGSAISDPSVAASLPGLDAEQWYEGFDRYSVLFLFDRDVPIVQSDEHDLMFRWGLGLGVVIMDGEIAKDAFAQGLDVDGRTYVNFLARPKIGLHYRFFENYLAFLALGYDFVPEDSLTVNLNSSRTKLGDVDASGFTIFSGLGFTW